MHFNTTSFELLLGLGITSNSIPKLIINAALILIASVNIRYCDIYVLKFSNRAVFASTKLSDASCARTYKFNAYGLVIVSAGYVLSAVFIWVSPTMYAFDIAPYLAGIEYTRAI